MHDKRNNLGYAARLGFSAPQGPRQLGQGRARMTVASQAISPRKIELLDMLSQTALQETSAPISLRQFAIQAGVSEPTLRHHFDDRQGLVISILRHVAGHAREFLYRCAQPGKDFEDSVRGYLDLAMEGFGNDVFARAHAFALVESIHDPVVAEAYLKIVIEPSLAAIEARLAPSLDPEGSDPTKVRETAFVLYSPVLLAILHQRLLKGDEARPMDLPRFFNRLTGMLTRGAEFD